MSATNPSSALNGVVIGLLSSFGSAFLIAVIFLIVYFFRYTSSGRIFLDRIGRPGEYDDEQAFAREEAEALESMEENQRTEYLRAKAFVTANPPESLQTDISLSQYLAIQEKGVSAWEFEPELEIANCFVEGRTEIEFFDSECTVLSKIYDKPGNTLLSIGMATKPYPLFRLPGFHKYSAAYTSTGQRRYNQPFNGTPVLAIALARAQSSSLATERNWRMSSMVSSPKTSSPAVGANGPCAVHVNFGQAGFVFIEANVKKWGLAPMTGSLAPPPPYGSEQGDILLEAGRKDGYSASVPQHSQSYSQSVQSTSRGGGSQVLNPQAGHGRTRSGNFRVLPPRSPGPIRSPTDISLAHFVPADESGEPSGSGHGDRDDDEESDIGLGMQDALNPPPDYTSPDHSDQGSRRNSSDSEENTPLIRVVNRSRSSTATLLTGPSHPPIPSYSDAVRDGATRESSSSNRPGLNRHVSRSRSHSAQ
ncbi:SPRY domain-containing protein [Verticillium dahliae]|nr:SPRY domain-containing protein [Verticillium dahliae]